MPDNLPMYRWFHPVHEIQDRIGTSSPRAWCFGSHDLYNNHFPEQMDSPVFLPRSISDITRTMSYIDTAEGEKNHLNITFPLSSN